MPDNDAVYFERRIREELAEAEQASSLEVRHVHETLAQMYRIRLDALAGAREAA